MTAPAAANLDSRERLIVVAALAGVGVLAWVWLIDMAARMAAGMDTAGGMAAMGSPQLRAWTPAEAVMVFAMWAIMMVGMMVPSAIPMVLIFAAMTRRAEARGRRMAPVWIFATGYIAAWTLFSAAATAAQWGLEQVALLSPMMASTSTVLGGIVLIAAGIYQWTPLKHACLSHCRAPADFLARHWRPGVGGALRTGIHHGLYCVGCCWVLMALLFVGGVMNLAWVAAITVFVLAEKLLPFGAWLGRVAGAALTGWGVFLLATA